MKLPVSTLSSPMNTCKAFFAFPNLLPFPEIIKPIGIHGGIDDCVIDVGVAHVGLYGTGVDTFVGQIESCAVPEHVGMDGEKEVSDFSCLGNNVMSSAGREGKALVCHEEVGSWRRVLF